MFTHIPRAACLAAPEPSNAWPRLQWPRTWLPEPRCFSALPSTNPQHPGRVMPWAWFPILPPPHPPPTHLHCKNTPAASCSQVGSPGREECGGFQLWHPSCAQPPGSALLPRDFSKARCALRPGYCGGGGGGARMSSRAAPLFLRAAPLPHKNPPCWQLWRGEQSGCVWTQGGGAVGRGRWSQHVENSECRYVHEHGVKCFVCVNMNGFGL